MERNSSRWVAGAVAAGLTLVAGSWLLGIGPLRDELAATRESVEYRSDRNDALQLAIVRLAGQDQHLDEYRAELAELRSDVPVAADLPGLTRQLQEAADRTGVAIVRLTSSTPVPLADPAAAVAVGSTAAGTGGAPATGVAGMQVSLTTVGTYDAVADFIAEVQTGIDRLVLLSGVSADSQTTAAAGGGRPATTAGDVEASFTAYAFTLPPTGTEATATDPAAEDSGTPADLPGSDRDPFDPLD